MDIKFNTNTDLFKLAKTASADSVISKEEKETLIKEASKDGILTRDERLFIKGLENTANIEKIKNLPESDFEPVMSFNIEVYEADEKKRDAIKDVKYADVGLDKFNAIMQDSKITSSSLSADINVISLLKSPEFRGAVNSLKMKMGDDKEAMLYLKELIQRNPPISDKNLISIMNKLENMYTTKYDSRMENTGYNTRDLVVSALHDISAPSDIAQRSIGTCVATSLQIKLASKDPIKYLNMVDSLAQNKSFESVPPNWSFTKEWEGINTNRSISAKLMQNAIMDFGDGTRRNYNSSIGDAGLEMDEALKVSNILFKEDFTMYNVSTHSPEQLTNFVKDSGASRANPVLVFMNYAEDGQPDAYHAIDVIGLDKKNNTVTIINPWGREETFSLDDMKKRIIDVAVPKGMEPRTKDDKTLLRMADNGLSRNQLKDLSIGEKTKLIELMDKKDTLTENEKKAVLTVLDSIFSGQTLQNEKAFMALTKVASFEISNLFESGKIKTNDPLYSKVMDKIIEYDKGCSLGFSLDLIKKDLGLHHFSEYTPTQLVNGIEKLNPSVDKPIQISMFGDSADYSNEREIIGFDRANNKVILVDPRMRDVKIEITIKELEEKIKYACTPKSNPEILKKENIDTLTTENIIKNPDNLKNFSYDQKLDLLNKYDGKTSLTTEDKKAMLLILDSFSKNNSAVHIDESMKSLVDYNAKTLLSIIEKIKDLKDDKLFQELTANLIKTEPLIKDAINIRIK